MTHTTALVTTHDYDEDACCTVCGFDGAEHAHWRHYTYEGKAASPEEAKAPLCTPHVPIHHYEVDDTPWDDDYEVLGA